MRNQLKGALVGILAVLFFGVVGGLVAQVQNTTTGRVYYTATRTIASGAKALSTTQIASGACSAAQTDTATGTLTTDTIDVTVNADPTGVTGYALVTTGMFTIVPYPTADTVNFKVCNLTLAAITPGSAITLNWKVTR